MLSRQALIALVYSVALVTAEPIYRTGTRQSVGRRAVDELNEEAFEEAQKRDDTATRAFSNVQIRTSNDQCLFVDKLSGDFRANLTPVQIADCGTTDGQGWDVITSGAHNDRDGLALIVSTLTNACLNVDTRRAAGDQVNLFSCGGRAAGEGLVTESQLFVFGGERGPGNFMTPSQDGKCLVLGNGRLDIADCQASAEQAFTFGDDAAQPPQGGEQPGAEAPGDQTQSTASQQIATSTSAQDASVTPPPVDAPQPDSGEPIPVSRAGGVLDAEAVAEAHKFDQTATRALQGANIRASDGRCLSVDSTAGDFRQNLIPVALVNCDESDKAQKFDIITAGVHNNGDAGEALISSAATNGCISFDGRRNAGDTVTVFSCGGRAAGEGETDNAQLYPFVEGSGTIVLEPLSGNGETCLIAGADRIESAACQEGDSKQSFELVGGS